MIMLKILQKIWPIACIFIIWFIFSSSYFVKGLIPFPSKYLVTFFSPWSAAYGMPVKNNAMPDVATQIYPWKHLTIETWKLGQVPLWNPYSFSGTPHLANYQSAVLSPVNVLFFLLPEIDAWSIMILLQPLLAGLCMYILLRTLVRSKVASLIGGVAFMFCGFMTVWMAYGTLGWAVLWLPLILTMVIRHFKKRSWWHTVLLSGAIAWSFVSGHFQMSSYILLATVAYILFETITKRNLRASCELLVAVAAGLLLSAPQILPSLEAYQQSVRSQLFTQTGGVAWQYLITIFAPDFFGNPVTRNDWFGYYAEWASYIGVVPLMLALFTLLGRKSQEVWFFLGLAIISILVATPSPLNALIIQLKLPALSTSYSARIILLASFSLSVLSGYGFDMVTDKWKKKRKNIMISYALVVTVVLLGLWSFLLVSHPLPADKLLIAKRNLILPTTLSIATFLLFFLGFIKKWPISTIVPMIFIALTAFDMLRYSTKWMPFDPRKYVFPPMEVTSFLRAKAGNNRVFGNVGNEMTGYFFLQGVEGYDAVYQARYGEFIGSAGDGTVHTPERSVVTLNKHGLNAEKILELLGVQYLLHRASDGRFGWAYPYWNYPFYQPVYKDKQYEVFENQKALPRVFLASSYVVAKDQQILQTLYDTSFDMSREVILEKKPPLEPQNGDGSVEISSYTPNTIRLTTSATVPKLLFISDAFDAGWKASVDSVPAPIYRADYSFRAVGIPAGTHVIRMWYWPDSFARGLWLAAIGFGIVAFGALQSWYGHRHH